MKKIILMLLAVTALTACSKFEPVSKGGDENVPVELYGDIYTGTATRGDGVIGGIPADGLVFDLYRANQTGATPAYTIYTTKVQGTLLTTKKITTDPGLYYLGTGIKSSFIGLHPVGGTLANNKVTYDLDGSDDILATQSVEGEQDEDPSPLSLTFKHLLTKIQVRIKSKDDEDPGALAAAEGIKSIKVAGKAIKAIVTLPNLSTETNAANVYPIIAADGTDTADDLSLWTDDGKALDDNDNGAILFNTDGTAKHIGSAIFLPTTPTDTKEVLTLKIITKGKNIEHPVPLPELEYKQGFGYTITIALSISKLGVEEFDLDDVEVDIAAWDEQAPEDEVVY
jgi:hypothetical protein